MKYKMVHARPIVTETDLYIARIFFNPRLKTPKYYLTVTDKSNDLLICENYPELRTVMQRMICLEIELTLDELFC